MARCSEAAEKHTRSKQLANGGHIPDAGSAHEQRRRLRHARQRLARKIGPEGLAARQLPLGRQQHMFRGNLRRQLQAVLKQGCQDPVVLVRDQYEKWRVTLRALGVALQKGRQLQPLLPAHATCITSRRLKVIK